MGVKVINQFPESKPKILIGAGTVTAPDKKEIRSISFLTDTVVTASKTKDGADALDISGGLLNSITWGQGSKEYWKAYTVTISSGSILVYFTD